MKASKLMTRGGEVETSLVVLNSETCDRNNIFKSLIEYILAQHAIYRILRRSVISNLAYRCAPDGPMDEINLCGDVYIYIYVTNHYCLYFDAKMK